MKRFSSAFDVISAGTVMQYWYGSNHTNNYRLFPFDDLQNMHNVCRKTPCTYSGTDTDRHFLFYYQSY